MSWPTPPPSTGSGMAGRRCRTFCRSRSSTGDADVPPGVEYENVEYENVEYENYVNALRRPAVPGARRHVVTPVPGRRRRDSRRTASSTGSGANPYTVDGYEKLFAEAGVPPNVRR